MRLKAYYKPNDIDEAYKLSSGVTRSLILGGGAYVRLHKSTKASAIDLSNLDLDYIVEKEDHLAIGAMTSLRSIEINEKTKDLFGNILSQVAGVPIRNIATIGGSICGKYPFSDLLPTLLVTDTKLKFYQMGEISLLDYLGKGLLSKDILMEIRIDKTNKNVINKCFKSTYNDFSISSLAVKKGLNTLVAIGARPQIAKLVTLAGSTMKGKSVDDLCDEIIDMFNFSGDYRASGDYRKSVSYAMLKAALEEV